MATSVEFIEFVCGQIKTNFSVSYKKMFGEYMVYVNNKPVLLVCDNMVFVKQLKQVEPLLQNAEIAVPYNGAKPHFVLDIENTELVENVISILEQVTPLPKKKKKTN